MDLSHQNFPGGKIAIFGFFLGLQVSKFVGGNRVGGQSGEASPFSSVGSNGGEKKTRGFFFGGESESGERLFSAKDAERKKEGVAGGRIDTHELKKNVLQEEGKCT